MKKFITLSCFALTVLISCKKNSSSPAQGFSDFLKNTEWVGTLDRAGYQYAPPASLRFRNDLSVVVYGPFFFKVNNSFIWLDSLQGTLKSSTEEVNNVATVVATLHQLGDVTMTISNRKTLMSTSTHPEKPTPFTLELYSGNGFSVEGSRWSGPVMGGGPTNGMLAYPDLSSIEFDKNTTSYMRQGKYVMAQPTPQLPTPGILKVSYKQIGAMLFMTGYNESNMMLIDYFGVLSPSKDKMMVFSMAIHARLPYYTQTIPWYGPIGQTPIILKQ